MITKYIRGMVYWVTLPGTTKSSIQSGRRPCIIVSNNVGNVFSSNITVVPCTTNLEKADTQSTHLKLSVLKDVDSVALCESIITIPKGLCESFMGILDEVTMSKLDECLRDALSLHTETAANPNMFDRKIEEQPKIVKHKKVSGKERNTKKATYLKEYEEKGVEYVMKKYGIPTISAASRRMYYYKKALDK